MSMVNNIKFENLVVSFDKRFDLLRINNCEFNDRKICLVGDEYSGNKILLYALSKLVNFKGNIKINDKDIKKISYKSDINIAFLPETPILKSKKVINNIKFIKKIRKNINFDINYIKNLLNDINLNDNIKNLSILQKQKISLMRAFLRPLDLLLIELNFNEFVLDEKSYLDFLNSLLGQNPNCMVIISSNHAIPGFKNIYMEYGLIKD